MDDYEIVESITNAIHGIDVPEPDLSEIEDKLQELIDAVNNGAKLIADAIRDSKENE